MAIQTSHRRGFTLIELLVVISIIALLIGILLPALGRAKDSALGTACLSNQKQLAYAFTMYANDHKEIPGYRRNADWRGESNMYDYRGRQHRRNQGDNYHPFRFSVLFPYVNERLDSVECPKAQRKANSLWDYTMLAGVEGAKPETTIRSWVEYPKDPARGSGGERGRFQSIPILIEEDAWWYNREIDDGVWAYYDQVTDRHSGFANICYLDGSAGSFKSPKGALENQEEPGDLTAQDLILVARNNEFATLYTQQDWGWINAPQ